MDIKKYIKSGIIEQYCMGLLTADKRASVERACQLYPEIKAELLKIELALEKYAHANAIQPNPELKGKILNTLQNQVEKSLTQPPIQFPLINRFSNHDKWLSLTKGMIPETFEGERIQKTIQHSDRIIQMLIVSSIDFNDETHDDLLESFLILEGECECTVGDHVFYLAAGGFAEIPLHQPHKVKILSSYVKAVLQRLPI